MEKREYIKIQELQTFLGAHETQFFVFSQCQALQGFLQESFLCDARRSRHLQQEQP